MLMRKRRPFLPVLIPAVFVIFVSIYALIVQLGQFYNDGNWLLLVLDIIVLIAAVWVLIEAAMAMVRTRNQEPDPEDEEALSEEELLPAGTPRK